MYWLLVIGYWLLGSWAFGPLSSASQTATLPPDIQQYLTQVAKFTPADLARLESGGVIAQIMPGASDTEVTTVAAVKVRASRDQVVSYYGQMISYVDGKTTLAFSKFSAPPALSDVRMLTLDADDISQIRSCKPGKCDLRLSGSAITALRGSIDWKAPNAAELATAKVREAVVAYVTKYMSAGDDALITYDDRSEAQSLKGEWQAILAASPYFQQYSAPLHDYLAQYPRRPLAGVKDVIYWSKDDYTGLKPVIQIVHGVIYQDPARPDRTVVAQKQLYASHYYDGSLAIAVAIGGNSAGAPTYLVYANRSRGDLLKGGFGGMRKSIAKGQAKSAAEQTLGTIKYVLEKQ